MTLYTYILFNLNTFNTETIDNLLYEHELICLAKTVKEKFVDKRSVLQIVNLIKEVYSIA